MATHSDAFGQYDDDSSDFPNGIPLQVLFADEASGDLTVEDPTGVRFVVPAERVGQYPSEGEDIVHTQIDRAPAGELERRWKDATKATQAIDAVRWASDERVADLVPSLPEPRSMLDVWSEERVKAGMPATMDALVDASSGSKWNPGVGRAGQPPSQPPAKSGWGEWDEEWDPKRKAWAKSR